MSKYVERNLNNGEEIIFKAKKSVWALLPIFLYFLVCLIAAIVLQISVFDKMSEASSDIASLFSIPAWVILVGISGIELIVSILRWISLELCITNKRVIGKMGVLSIHTLDYMIGKVDNVCIEAGVIGNIFNYHTVSVRGGGEIEKRHKDKNNFKGIKNAREFKNILTEAIEQHAASARKDQAMEIAHAMAEKDRAESLTRAIAAKEQAQEVAKIMQENSKSE